MNEVIQAAAELQAGKLGWNYIREQLQPLAELKETPEILDQLEARRIKFER